MTKLTICPDVASYTTGDGLEVVSTQLDGGAPRIRRDVLGAWASVSVQWTVTPFGMKYLRAFYRAQTVSGSLQFEIDLRLDDEVPTEHTALFMPSSMQVSPIDTLNYSVTAQLYVQPRATTQDDLDYVDLYNLYGEAFVTQLPYIANELDQIVNVKFPSDMEPLS